MTEIEQESVSVGHKLRLERERQGMSVDDVAAKLHLSAGQIEAIEDGDYSSLPAMTFVRGFVRNYVKLLNLESENLLESMPQVSQADQSRISVPGERISFRENIPFPSTRRRDWHEKMLQALLLVAFMIVLVLIFFHAEVVRILTHGDHPVPLGDKTEQVSGASGVNVQIPHKLNSIPQGVNSKPNTQPLMAKIATTASIQPRPIQQNNIVTVPAQVSVPPDANSINGQIVLIFNATSWVQVTDSTGKSLMSGLNTPHTKLMLHGVPPYHVVIGNAPEVELVYNGKPVDLGPYTHSKIARLNLE